MKIIFWFLVYILLMGIIRFLINRKHLLIILIRLEFIVLIIFIILFFYLHFFSYESYFSIIFLSIRVCERALGLSLLVSIIRSHGRDYFNLLNLLW